MTNEEAIKQTEKCIFAMKDCIERHKKSGPTGEMQETLEYYEIILKAMKNASFSTTVQDDHFRGVRKMVPLTIEELRKMDGQPVWSRKHKEWFLICKRSSGCVMYDKNGFLLPARDFVDYGLYAYPPVHIDREAWEPCEWCSDLGDSRYKLYAGFCMQKAADDIYEEETEEMNYCPKCGRPLTEEAWAELEKRLRR